MSYDPKITLNWADGEHVFALPLKQRFELELLIGRKLAAISPEAAFLGSAPAIFARIGRRQWLADDLRETLRLGLIGGGATPPEALRLVNDYGPGARPDEESLEPVVLLLTHTLFPPDDLEKKAKAGEESGKTSASPPPKSTARRRRSA